MAKKTKKEPTQAECARTEKALTKASDLLNDASDAACAACEGFGFDSELDTKNIKAAIKAATKAVEVLEVLV